MKIIKTIDNELLWFFGYAESAVGIGSLTLLPTHESAALAAAPDEEGAIARRALALVHTIKTALRALPAHHAGVLRAVYTPRRWPFAVQREFAGLTPLVVRLTCAANPWPHRTARRSLETAAADMLARMIAAKTAQRAALRKEAKRLYASALTSYVRTRHQGGPSIAR